MVSVCVFISHSWAYSEHYNTLANWIFGEQWNVNGTPIQFIDSSVPKGNPIHYAPNEQTLRAAIYQRIAAANVVVIPTGMYANYSKWIEKEIAGAQQYAKPILAVNPWGQGRKSSVVGSAAAMNVGWNKKPVVQGVWDLASGGY
jgi:hypothetical protein